MEFRHSEPSEEQRLIDSKINQLRVPKRTDPQAKEKELRRRMRDLQRR